MQGLKSESTIHNVEHVIQGTQWVGIDNVDLAYQQEAVGTIILNQRLWYRIPKRLFDIVASAMAIILLSPVFLITSLAIKLEDPKGKVLYIAPRGGLNGRPFPCLKFRSMYANADEMKVKLMDQNEMSGPVFKIKDDPRITKIGKFIRKTSIDELPQLFNVFVGQMSFVGPRPLPIAEEKAVEGKYKTRELVKPGITCICQVSGRNAIDFDDWMKLDIEYVQKQSLMFDLVLLLKTIPAVLSNRGAS